MATRILLSLERMRNPFWHIEEIPCRYFNVLLNHCMKTLSTGGRQIAKVGDFVGECVNKALFVFEPRSLK
ncbi:hypothetical protein HDU90_006678, partial [Geranomyces variabilis]